MKWLTFILSLLAFSALSAEVTFQWRANTEPELAGYYLYYGPSTGKYTNKLFIAGRLTTNWTVRISGRQYFALTAVYTNAMESGLTAEVSYRPPPGIPTGFTGTALWLITEQSCNALLWEATITNEIASYWPMELFRSQMIRKPLEP